MIKKLFSAVMFLAASITTSHATSQTHQFGASLNLSGPLTQGAMLVGHTDVGYKVLLDGRAIKVATDGTFVIGFGRDAKLVHHLSVEAPNTKPQRFDLVLTKRDYKISRVTGISKAITHPSKKNQLRAAKDSKQVRAARKVWSNQLHFSQQFVLPVQGRISGVYGSQRFYNGKAGRPHYGLDIARPTGTVVHAPADGIVRMFVPDMFYSGGTLIIDHGMGVSSTFLHLSAGLVKAGDKVVQGQAIAKIGTTGRSTGPHLDWRMNWLNQRIDPQLLLTSVP